jgi:hypothetical protein
MADLIQQVVTISTQRYNENLETQAALAQAYLAIAKYARDVQKAGNDPRSILSFLKRPHADANLSKACKDVFRLLGTTPIA